MDKPDGKLFWNLALPFGEWNGHENGHQQYTELDGAACVEYFNLRYKSANRAMPIDYDHSTFDSGSTLAAGWIWELAVYTEYDKALDVDKDEFQPGVYMHNEWTAQATDQIKARQYRYLSPVIVRNALDTITGEEVPIQLFTVALTNVPFMLDKFATVKASFKTEKAVLFSRTIDTGKLTFTNNVKANAMDPKKMLEDVKAALGLGADAGEEEVLNLVKKLVEFASMFPSEGGDGEMPAPEEMPEMAQAANSAMKTVKALTDKYGVTADKLGEKIEEFRNSAKPKDPDAELQKRVAELEADAIITEFADRIPKADRDYWRNRAIKDAKDTRELLSRQPVIMNSEVVKPATKKASEIDLTDNQLAVCKRLGITPEKYKATLAQKPSTN